MTTAPSAIRAVAASPTLTRSSPRSRRATMTSADQSSVAARIMTSAGPTPIDPVGPMSRTPPNSATSAITWASPSDSRRNTTARPATQMKRVLWISAAPGPVAWASPLKKRMNGTLPPMIAMAASPAASVRRRDRPSRAPPRATRSPSRTRPTSRLRAPVRATGSLNSLTTSPLTKIERPEMPAVAAASAMPHPVVRGIDMMSS